MFHVSPNFENAYLNRIPIEPPFRFRNEMQEPQQNHSMDKGNECIGRENCWNQSVRATSKWSAPTGRIEIRGPGKS